MTTENLPAKKNQKTDIIQSHDLSIIEQVVMQGDLSKLNPEQRVTYYHRVCESTGLNPYTRPFDYISLNGKLTLYAKKDATEQLRKVNEISITDLEGRMIDDIYIVTAKAKTRSGRIDQATGAVTLGHLKGEQKANAIMKAETKAKRRVTLSISGMGWVDETEIETIPSAVKVNVNLDTGVIQEQVKDNTFKTLALNPPNSASSSNIDTNLEHIQVDTSLNEKISKDQLDQMLTLYSATDDQFKENYEKYMKQKWNASEYHDLPLRAYQPTMTAIQRNLELNQQKGGLSEAV